MEAAVPLRRRLGLALLVLYGTGITVGAGIYVLIGAVAGHAGVYAPWSFLVAAAVMTLTVASYAELSTRFPVSAGEAAYVRAAFQSRALATAIGLLTVVTGVVSSAAVTLGSAGYIQQFIDLPQGLIVVIVTVLLAAVAAWGILESVVLASLFTLIEVGGLVTVILAGLHADLPIVATIIRLPPLNAVALSGIGFGSLLAFFAFIGVRGFGQCRGGGEGPAPRHPPRHGADPWHIDGPVCAGRRRRRQRRVGGEIVVLASAAQPGVSPGRRRQSSDDQRDRHRGDAEHDPCTDDDGGSGRLRARTRGRVAGPIRAGASPHRHAVGRYRLYCRVGRSAGVVRAVDATCGSNLAGDAGGVRAGQSCPAAATVPRRAVRQSARERSHMDTRNRTCDLPRHDGGCLIQVNGRVALGQYERLFPPNIFRRRSSICPLLAMPTIAT